MTKPKTPSQIKKHPVKLPKTRGEQHALKKIGSMLGHFKLKVGRPPKPKESSSAATAASTAKKKPPSLSSSSSSSTASSAAAAASVAGSKRKEVPIDCHTSTEVKQRRTKYVNWDEHAAVLQLHVDARRSKHSVKPTNDNVLTPSYMTVSNYIRRLASHAVTTGEQLTVQEWIEQHKKKAGRNALLSKEVRNRIQNIIAVRDGRNTPMLRKHVLEIIESVMGCTKNKLIIIISIQLIHKKVPLLQKA